jgi:hypothetical protein
MNRTDEKLHLESLDPGSRDPGFWLGFHSRVMADAREELARRRMMGGVGVVDLVFAWRKTLVPMALMAAALAGILMAGSGKSEEPVQMVAVDDLLREDLNLLSTSGVSTGEALFLAGSQTTVEGGF